jgi:hypothetical protein
MGPAEAIFLIRKATIRKTGERAGQDMEGMLTKFG